MTEDQNYWVMYLKAFIHRGYGRKPKQETLVIFQADSIIEKIHCVIANLIWTYNLQKNYIDEYDTSNVILTTEVLRFILYVIELRGKVQAI